MNVLLLIIGLFAWAQAQAETNPWALIKAPTVGLSESIGAYAGGCLKGGKVSLQDGVGYQMVRLSRKRFYGHSDMVSFIESLGKQTDENNFGALLVGDLGQARGGPTPGGHASHQNGLDVDIWFKLLVRPPLHRLTDEERESIGSPSVIDPTTLEPNDLWAPDFVEILRFAAEHPRVERIFVAAAIKKYLCNTTQEREWLRKLRPWYGHRDHFHVRLACPAGSKACVAQAPPEEGDGCDASLEWWLNQEKGLGVPPVNDYEVGLDEKGQMPKACLALLKE